MSSRNEKFFFVLAVSCVTLSASAFELTTHAALTNRAYAISTLGSQPSHLTQLGLVNLPSPFERSYYDFTSILISKRAENAYELSKFVPGSEGDRLRINGWLMRGAVREDDGGLAAAIRAGEPYLTDPDPYGLINRFCNHFFDPITRNALSTSLFSDPLTRAGCPNSDNFNAANWAIGANAGGADAFSASPLAVDNFRNHFTIPSAREAMWRALTLTNKVGAPAQRIAGDTEERTRKAYWASTFRALGNVLHLNQDMAQPQHTRNEGHGLGPSSSFERYVDARAAQVPDTIFKFDGEGNIFIEQGGLPPLPLEIAFPIPRFNRYSDYWSTDQSSASILAGKGLADYSSRGFFTPAKNLGTSYNGFPNPVNNENVYNITTDPIGSTGDCTGYAGRGQYARGNLPVDFLVTLAYSDFGPQLLAGSKSPRTARLQIRRFCDPGS